MKKTVMPGEDEFCRTRMGTHIRGSLAWCDAIEIMVDVLRDENLKLKNMVEFRNRHIKFLESTLEKVKEGK